MCLPTAHVTMCAHTCSQKVKSLLMEADEMISTIMKYVAYVAYLSEMFYKLSSMYTNFLSCASWP